jgi:membrane protein implicated in regulation of membrane protease activity
MCACGCFVLAAVIAALVYTVMHGLWLAAIAVLLFTAALGWLGRKMAVSRRPRNAPPQT